jgi:uncharacterized protein (TIGR03382 family)
MIAPAAALALLLAAEPYVRSHVSPGDPESHCLWWQAGTVTYHQSQGGNPENGGAEFGAITRSFETWQAQMNQCGNLTLTEGARLPDRKIGFDAKNLSSNTNIILFRHASCAEAVLSSDACWRDGTCGNKYDCWAYNELTIALTTSTYDTNTGRLYDADVEFNDDHFYFTTTGSGAPVCSDTSSQSCRAFDIQNTMTHEAGHMIGLDHTDFPGSTMNPTAPKGEITKRDLDTGSKGFVCDVYPKGSASKDCVVTPVTSQLGRAGCSATGAAAGAWLGAAALALWALRRKGART